MNFHIGQKVVCVNASIKEPKFHGYKLLRKGAIYTIRGISTGYVDGDIGLHLEEINNPDMVRPDGSERGFGPARFRPLIERSTKTGMAILRKVADNAAKRREMIPLD